MLFKQGVIKEEKIKLFIGIIGGILPYIPIILVGVSDRHNVKPLIVLLLLLSPIYILLVLLGLINLEWFYIYSDRIEVRYIFGKKNIVYFDKVSFVEETTINLTSRGMKKEFYIFNDGRKNNNSYFDLNSCYNKKKFNLRIYKTEMLEAFISNSIGLNIIAIDNKII